MAVHLWIDAKGKELRHRFVRGLMRSAARLTYEEVQAARDALASGDNETGASDNAAVIEAVLPGLYGAFQALLAARLAHVELAAEAHPGAERQHAHLETRSSQPSMFHGACLSGRPRHPLRF